MNFAAADDTPAANPARPTVTNPATLPPVGYLEFENGYLGSIHSPDSASQYGINQVTKIAVHPRLMLIVGFQPFEASTVLGTPGTSNDAGGINVGAQVVLYTPGTSEKTGTGSSDPGTETDAKTPLPTIAVGYQHNVYGGTAPDIDLGSATNIFLVLFSGDFGNFHYDTNYIVNEQDGTGIHGNTIHRAQFAQTISVNHPFFNPNLQLAVEVYHFSQPLVTNTDDGRPTSRANLVDLLIAPSYQVRPNIVIDAGFSYGMTSTSTTWQSFAGFTYLLPKRLWKGRS